MSWKIFFNKSNSKIVGLENTIPSTSMLIYRLQYDSDKKKLRKRLKMLIKNN